eukprot:6462465-Amphidinium_carterae.1
MRSSPKPVNNPATAQLKVDTNENSIQFGKKKAPKVPTELYNGPWNVPLRIFSAGSFWIPH